jgi:hypothetical protein
MGGINKITGMAILGELQSVPKVEDDPTTKDLVMEK